MAAFSDWDDLIAGKGCVFCAPREDKNEFSVKVADLSVSTLYLERNQAYRGYCVMIFKARHVTGLEHLADGEYKSYTGDLRRAMKAISAAVKPDHMNYATLGNWFPHLHYHIIPRFKGDARWRASVWPAGADMPHQLLAGEQEYDVLAADIKKRL